MDRNTRSSQNVDGDGSVRLEVFKLAGGSSGDTSTGSRATMFEPHTPGATTKTSNTGQSSPATRPAGAAVRAPEKKLTLFALRLAILEKSASRIGTLGFIWASVVLLGGFAVTLNKTDFWFVTVILVIEGTRIFSRSHELEWQHESTWSLSDMGIGSALKSSSNFIAGKLKNDLCSAGGGGSREISVAKRESRKQTPNEKESLSRTWTTSEVPVFPMPQWVFLSRNISKFLNWLQLVSAAACVALTMLKLVRRDFGEIGKDDLEKRNRNASLIIFYALALADALLLLLEKAYWEWKFKVERLLEKVNDECELGESGLTFARRFFYDSYSKCINSSIFDGLKMDMISFAMELLESNSPEEQLVGARILRKFSENPKFSEDTLQKIGTNLPVIERLLEMLNWKDRDEEKIRYSAAEILNNLAMKPHNTLRIAEIPGAMESISCLLHVCRSITGASDQISEKTIIFDDGNYSPWSFNQLGLQILKKLARDHDICGKIGNTRGLLPKIIDFIHADEQLLRQPTAARSQIDTVKRSLQVLKMLASTSGNAGEHLRKEISEIVFTVSYIRDILKYGEQQLELQLLGIQILTSLAIEEEVTMRIGATGGVLKDLFSIFFNRNAPEDQNEVRKAAGEALAMLTLQSKTTCHLILKLQQNKKLIKALKDPLLRVKAARIMRNLCYYSGDDSFQHLKGLTAAVPTILEAIMTQEKKLQEVMVGAAARLLKLVDGSETTALFQKAEINKLDMVNQLLSILKKYQQPSTKVPGMRRYTIELAIWMMRDDAANTRNFLRLGMIRELESVLDTTSELESFNIFSGTVGVYRHKEEMHSLVETAMALLGGKLSRSSTAFHTEPKGKNNGMLLFSEPKSGIYGKIRVRGFAFWT